MIRIRFLLWGVMFLAACSPTSLVTSKVLPGEDGAIDNLVSDLSATRGLWVNGFIKLLDLPEGATPEQIVDRFFETATFDGGRAKRYRILEHREVLIPPLSDRYTAVLVETEFGAKIVLAQYISPTVGWTSRVRDAPM